MWTHDGVLFFSHYDIHFLWQQNKQTKDKQPNFDLHTSLVLWRFYGYFYYGIRTLQNNIS